ncbi:phosphate signaling complex protein PhoU [Azospirillum formosense]|uniref:Phosphate-specific transport system accessory protein PhoU n=1 Tax=Azospirillum formosense TaxID=861533 RepID=A0ABX2KYF0_9PROT|nr:phosphate signaling complex protein PhoU [Azospirillum formosense]MBY3752964.1 phosphate signaling complex protein PhoU [Azospirillum formosense]NUB21606.1 phosphate signaling complex protein PhoU [Azospirillum formosense]
MTGGHTVAAFDAELARLHQIIVTMGRRVEEQFAAALEAIAERDAGKASRVIEADAEIDRLELELEALSVRLLALRQPMAKDLRDIVSALKIASNLERMGDFASSVAKRAVTLADLPVEPPVASLSWMGETVLGMIRDVIAAYDGQDAERALAVRNRDGQVDAAYTSLFREFLTYMMESPAQITGCTHLLFVAKAIERAGDHATNVAENICYIVQGRLPSEERTKGDLSSFTVVEKR